MENRAIQSGWEVFNLWVFRFLVGVLPYVTPLPLSFMTADSAAKFLDLNIYVAATLVFGLEGIGLLCTSLAVDAVVAWVKSRSLRGLVPVLLFIAILIAYINILITLNVTLEQADGNTNPQLSRVITLLCYLPLISGVINGWNKLNIETRTKQEADIIREEELAERHRNQQIEVTQQENEARRNLELEKLRIQEEQKTERARAKAQALAAQPQQVYQQVTPAVASQESASQHRDEMLQLMNDVYRDLGTVPTVKQMADQYNLDYERNKGYISTLRKKWAVDNNVDLTRKSKTS
jgi:uncharacterized membrane protein